MGFLHILGKADNNIDTNEDLEKSDEIKQPYKPTQGLSISFSVVTEKH